MEELTRSCLTSLIRSGAASLEERQDVVNRLNVFPVPDGDTGTNLFLTVKAGLEEMEGDGSGSFAVMLGAFARGSLMGSRGNSGIIFSQMMEGMASEIGGLDAPDAADIKRSIEAGTRLAYRSVRKPVEGTILTVLREMSASMAEAEGGARELLERAYASSADSLARTMELLPALARAGVVDSGAAGLVAFIEGAARAMGIGDRLVDWEALAPSGGDVEYWGPDSGVEFLIRSEPDRLQALERELAGLGNSLVVAGTSPPYRVHIHTDEPLSVLDAARRAGDVSDLQVASFSRFRESGGERGEPAGGMRVLAFCSGDGVAELFERMGAATMFGGPGNQPSTGEIIQAIHSFGGGRVFLLPNDPDTLQAAEMAVRMRESAAKVVPTVSPLQGIAAMEEFVEGLDPELTRERMARAASAVRTGSVARAIRDSDLGSVRVEEGDFLGFLDGAPVASDPGLPEAAVSVTARLLSNDGRSLMTVFTGADISGEDEEAARRAIERDFPELELEWYRGGQPHYQLLMGIRGDGV